MIGSVNRVILVGTLGKSLSDSVRAYNATVGSLEHRVLPSARRFTDLGVQPREPMPTLKAIDDTMRDANGGGDSPDPGADETGNDTSTT